MQVNMYGAADAARKRSAEQTAQQRDQGDADEGNAAASHELLHALALGRGVITAVTFHEVHSTPTRPDRHPVPQPESSERQLHC